MPLDCEWNQDMPDESGMPDEFVSRSLSDQAALSAGPALTVTWHAAHGPDIVVVFDPKAAR